MSPTNRHWPCPACCSEDSTAWGEKDGFLFRRCRSCGTLATDPGAAQDLYDHYYDRASFTTPAVVRASLQRLVLSAERYRVSGRWLDIGFGEGGLLEAAAAQGWQCYGTEVSERVLEHARARGFWVSARAQEDPRFAAEGFDVVSLIEVLEHVSEPRSLVQAAARWLRPGGLFYATTPNGRSLNRWVFGAAWSVFSPPEHLTLWTGAGLSRALRHYGLSPLEIRTEGLNPNELLSRLRRRPGNETVPSRNDTGLALNAALSSSPARRRFKALANAALSRLQLGDTLKVRAVRLGGES